MIRAAPPADVPEIHAMIRELADYERSLEHARATEEQLRTPPRALAGLPGAATVTGAGAVTGAANATGGARVKGKASLSN